eukprot:TRINITY_DN5204_c0_g1_i1.p1 TRINITY_DN5204_c0_g1~~TRINITY_DN5204_c0_g1_i1.p1  ORF type:complete len:349 (+),score=115.71 TRINITY_DN5204_c0_g1_i1:58-1047(+)
MRRDVGALLLAVLALFGYTVWQHRGTKGAQEVWAADSAARVPPPPATPTPPPSAAHPPPSPPPPATPAPPPLPPGGAKLPNRSVCYSVPDFKAWQPTPLRSPMLLVDALLPLVKGRHYCEVGTRDGDHIWCLARLGTTGVTGFEFVKSHCNALEKRGVPSSCGNFLNTTREEVQQCDDFFWWPNTPEATQCFLSHLHLVLTDAEMAGKKVYVATDQQYKLDVRVSSRDQDFWGGRHLREIHFDERSDSVPHLQRMGLSSPRWVEAFSKRVSGAFELREYPLRPGCKENASRILGSSACSEFLHPPDFEQLLPWFRPVARRPSYGKRRRR